MHEVNTLLQNIHSVFLVGWGLIFFRHFSARLRHRLLRSGSVSFSADLTDVLDQRDRDYCIAVI